MKKELKRNVKFFNYIFPSCVCVCLCQFSFRFPHISWEVILFMICRKFEVVRFVLLAQRSTICFCLDFLTRDFAKEKIAPSSIRKKKICFRLFDRNSKSVPSFVQWRPLLCLPLLSGACGGSFYCTSKLWIKNSVD